MIGLVQVLKKKKLPKFCKQPENQLPVWKHIQEQTPQGSLSHTDTHLEWCPLWNLSLICRWPDGVFSRQWENLAVSCLCRWFSKHVSSDTVLSQPQKIEMTMKSPSKMGFLSWKWSAHSSAKPPGESQYSKSISFGGNGRERRTNRVENGRMHLRENGASLGKKKRKWKKQQ